MCYNYIYRKGTKMTKIQRIKRQLNNEIAKREYSEENETRIEELQQELKNYVGDPWNAAERGYIYLKCGRMCYENKKTI